MNLNQFFLILRARYRIVLFGLCGTLLAALCASMLMPKRYTAVTAVVVDVKSPDPVAGMPLPAMTLPGYMATQVDIINSDRVAQHVIKRLGFGEDPALQERWREATGGRGTFESWLGDSLQSQLEVRPSRDSNVINIAVRDKDPQQAARIANAFAQSYIDTTVELRTDPARQYALWFDQQGASMRKRLEHAQAQLSEYQQANGIVANNQRLDFENQKLNELQTQLVLAETASVDAHSKQKGGSVDSLQEVMQSPIVQQLKAEIAMQDSRLQEAARRIGVNHPQYKSMQAQVDTLKQKLGAETARIRSGIDTSRRVSESKVAELKAAIEAHKQNILSLRAQMDGMAVLQREVDAAQKAYDTVAERFSQSSLESQSNQTNINVLTSAIEPVHPSSPRIALNLAVAAVLGAVLGVLAALLTELRDRRIRSADDIEYTLGMPVLIDFRARPHSPRLLAGRHLPAISG